MIMMIWPTWISKLIFWKKIIFEVDLSWTLASKKRVKKILKEIGKENKIWKFFHQSRFLDLDAFWYDDWYWKPSPGSTLNDFNNGLTIFYDLSSFFNKISASCKFSLKSWNSNFFFQKTKIDVYTQNFQKPLLWDESPYLESISNILSSETSKMMSKNISHRHFFACVQSEGIY